MLEIGEVRRVPDYFTQQQRQFIKAVATGQHLYLRATAGSGKTSTIQEAVWHVKGQSKPVAYFVYGRAARDSLGSSFPNFVRVSTIHASGYSQLARLRKGKLEIDIDKSLRLSRLLYPQFKGNMHRKLAKLWGQLRERGGMKLDCMLMADLAAIYELTESFVEEVFMRFAFASVEDWLSGGNPDFTDQLWLPLILEKGRASFGVVFVDEAQDLTPLRQAYVGHVLGLGTVEEGQLVLVGDSDQAIFQYSGADPLGMARLAKKVGAVEYPLSVSWRCPVSHVEIARHATPFIEAAPEAIMGSVEHVRASELPLKLVKGQTVLCRTNAPLIALALELLARQVSVDLRGRDLDKLLTRAAQDIYGAKTSFSVFRVQERLSIVLQNRLKPLIHARDQGDKNAKRRIQEEKDLFECMALLMNEVSRRVLGSSVLLQDVVSLITKLCASGGDVLLCTIHRSKGLEWRDVTLLFPERLPAFFGIPDEERCVLFVALTRSKETLRFAYGEKAWAADWRVKPYSEKSGSWRWLEEKREPAEVFSLTQADSFVFQEDFYDMQDLSFSASFEDIAQDKVPDKEKEQSFFSQQAIHTPIAVMSTERQQLFAAQQALKQRQQQSLDSTLAVVLQRQPSLQGMSHLYQGQRRVYVYEMRAVLIGLLSSGRTLLKQWAKAEVEALQPLSSRQVIMVDGELYQFLADLSSFSLRLDLSRLLKVIYFRDSRFEVLSVKSFLRKNESVVVDFNLHQNRFDILTGELYGVDFSLSHPFVHSAGLYRLMEKVS